MFRSANLGLHSDLTLKIPKNFSLITYTNSNKFSLIPSPKGEGQDEGFHITTFWDWYYDIQDPLARSPIFAAMQETQNKNCSIRKFIT